MIMKKIWLSVIDIKKYIENIKKDNNFEISAIEFKGGWGAPIFEILVNHVSNSGSP